MARYRLSVLLLAAAAALTVGQSAPASKLCCLDDATLTSVLTALSASRVLRFVQVGACVGGEDGTNDGINDPIFELAKSLGWRGVLVEPVPHLMRRVQLSYGYAARSGRFGFEPNAVCPTAWRGKAANFFSISEQLEGDIVAYMRDRGVVSREMLFERDYWIGKGTLGERQMVEQIYASFNRAFKGVDGDGRSLADRRAAEKFAARSAIRVMCVGYHDLLQTHSDVLGPHVHYLRVDAEGADWLVVESALLGLSEEEAEPPEVVCFEEVHLDHTPDAEAQRLELLGRFAYSCLVVEIDLCCFRGEARELLPARDNVVSATSTSTTGDRPLVLAYVHLASPREPQSVYTTYVEAMAAEFETYAFFANREAGDPLSLSVSLTRVATMEDLPADADAVVVTELFDVDPSLASSWASRFAGTLRATRARWPASVPMIVKLHSNLAVDGRVSLDPDGTAELKAALSDATVVVGVSRFHARALASWHGDSDSDSPRFTHIHDILAPKDDVLSYLGVALPQAAARPYDPNKLLYAMSPSKGLDGALLMFRLALLRIPTLMLYIAVPNYSRGSLEGVLDAAILRHGLPRERVVLLGSLPRAELIRHVAESLCLFHPSLFEETFGNIYAEANLVGTPALTFPGGAKHEVLHGSPPSHGGQVVNSCSVDEALGRLEAWHKGARPAPKLRDELAPARAIARWREVVEEAGSAVGAVARHRHEEEDEDIELSAYYGRCCIRNEEKFATPPPSVAAAAGWASDVDWCTSSYHIAANSATLAAAPAFVHDDLSPSGVMMTHTLGFDVEVDGRSTLASFLIEVGAGSSPSVTSRDLLERSRAWCKEHRVFADSCQLNVLDKVCKELKSLFPNKAWCNEEEEEVDDDIDAFVASKTSSGSPLRFDVGAYAPAGAGAVSEELCEDPADGDLVAGVLEWVHPAEEDVAYDYDERRGGTTIAVKLVVSLLNPASKVDLDKLSVCLRASSGGKRCFPARQHTMEIEVRGTGTHALEAWMNGPSFGVARSPLRRVRVLRQEEPESSGPGCSSKVQQLLRPSLLERPFSENGRLSLVPTIAELPKLQVFLRLSPRKYGATVQDTLTGITIDVDQHPQMGRRSPVGAMVLSLRASLAKLTTAQRARAEVTTLLSGFQSDLHRKQWAEWVRRKLAGLGLKALNVDPYFVAGNNASFAAMMGHRVLDEDEDKDEDAVVLLLEDDNVLLPTALEESLEMFATHDPCFIFPNDFVPWYKDAMRAEYTNVKRPELKTAIIAGRRRHWRTAPYMSMPVTFSTSFFARRATIRHFWAQGLLPHPSDDVGQCYAMASSVGPDSALIVSPLPALGAQVENVDAFTEQEIGLYVDFVGYANRLLDEEEAASLIAVPWAL